ncbi:hypothetical protein EB796_003005 [Bugula neritina]|uniref:Uncharacterized protein n=1 Tax=Bugula neritina TaxID=10212 RepID=A0A7J7KLP4_BUGNE|nr:hypothetical protein EB796_003005 [Bugula neritina]
MALQVLVGLLGALVLASATRNDPCLPGNHATLDQPDRSTAISIGSANHSRSDETLSKGWYVFTSGAGGEIPTSPPKVGDCSSIQPIWLNGESACLVRVTM